MSPALQVVPRAQLALRLLHPDDEAERGLRLAVQDVVGDTVEARDGVLDADGGREVDPEGQRLGVHVPVGDDVVATQHLNRWVAHVVAPHEGLG